MGNSTSGRPAKPLAILQIKGTARKSRHAKRTVEGKAGAGVEHPEGLSPKAQWLWDFVVKELEAMGVAKRIDTAHLWSMCEMWGLYRDSFEIAKLCPTNKDARIAVISYLAAFESAASKCGLTPADRAKLHAEPTSQPDEFETFLSNKA